MIFSKPLAFCLCLLNAMISVHSTYDITLNGQTFQVQVIGQDGVPYQDKSSMTDDYGQLLDEQKESMCSSLKSDFQCTLVSNNDKMPRNIFTFFPSRESQSVIAQLNDEHSEYISPHLLKQSMDTSHIQRLSRAGIQLRQIQKQNLNTRTSSIVNNNNRINLVGSRKIKFKPNNKNNKNDKNDENKRSKRYQNRNDGLDDMDTDMDELTDMEVDVEFYSNVDGEQELMDALGLSDQETVDRIVSQLIASYIDNDSDEVDVSQIFANELLNLGDGDINLDETSVQEMNDLLNVIAEKHREKARNHGSETGDESDDDDDDIVDVFDDDDMDETQKEIEENDERYN